jgi:phosphotransferase system enzyme I (PtsI)
MIEVPSAALTVEQYAKEVDFLSIGTNDLTQYVLAVDRGNDLVSDLFQELHPSILRLIKHIADVGREYGLPVSVCGEMASDTRVVPLLVGLGIAELSVSPVYIPHVKRVVRAVEHAELAALADLALQANDEAEVNAHLDAWLATHPFDLLHFIEAAPGHVVGAQPTPGQ